MHEYYFANYRLLMDDTIGQNDHMEYLADFSKAMPATHTFTLRLGSEMLLDEKFSATRKCPVVCTTDGFDIHDTLDSWAIIPLMDEHTVRRHGFTSPGNHIVLKREKYGRCPRFPFLLPSVPPVRRA